MSTIALIVALIACAAIIVIGARFILVPRQATIQYGIVPDNVRAFTEIKGVRDIASGIVLVVVWAAGGRHALGWALVADAITPVGDMIIVLSNRGKRAQALSVHGLTAAVIIAAGLILVAA